MIKKFLNSIRSFFSEFQERSDVFDKVIEAIQKNRGDWVEMKDQGADDYETMIYKKEGELFGTKVIFGVLTTEIILLNGKGYQYFTDGTYHLRMAFNPELERRINLQAERSKFSSFNA